MCLAVPVRVVELQAGDMAVVDLGGIRKEVSLALVDDVAVGDYVILHVGYALSKLDPAEAERTLALFAEAGLSLPPLQGEGGGGEGARRPTTAATPPSPLPPLPEGEGNVPGALPGQRA